MRRACLAALTLAALALPPAAARAQVAAMGRAPSPRWGTFEIGAGLWYPNVDSAFTPSQLQSPPGEGPWQQTFGGSRRWNFRVGLAKTLFDGFGSLDLGLRTGFFSVTGKGFVNIAPVGQPAVWQRSGDNTAFRMIPTSLTLTYRLDLFAERYNVPFAPYGRIAFERYNWWITNGSGATVKKGATNGYSVAGGVALMLDFFDPGLARELDAETGINHTYLYFDATKGVVDDFGSKTSIDLSDKTVSYNFGMMFVF